MVPNCSYTHTQVRQAVIGLFATIVLAASLIWYSGTAANAVSGDCAAIKQTEAKTLLPDDNRVRAMCSKIGPNTRATGKLTITGNTDDTTGWFTKLNTYYYSSWKKCPLGCSATLILGSV
jgi:hypothetical protein